MAFVVRVALQSRSCFVLDAVGGFSRGRMKKTNYATEERRERDMQERKLCSQGTHCFESRFFFSSRC